MVREGDNRLGPNLHKVVGRKAGSLPDYPFSSALKEAGFVWDEEKLDRFMLGTIYPHSFQLIISINILALIIVGGMGSLPGVALGAAVLIGLPEALREFGEFRFLFYGLAIIAVMRLKPEGLWPSAAKRREMRLDAETQAVQAAAVAEQRA